MSNTFIFAIGTFSSKILVILMLRFYTGMMTTDEMVVADLIIKTTSILYPVVSLSIGQAIIRYGLERRRRKSDVFTIGLATILCGFVIALPFHPLLGLIHYNTSTGATGSLLEYQWLIYLYVLTSCTQNACSQFIRALGYVRLYAVDGIFRTLVTILLNILYLTVFKWNIFGYVFSIICSDALSTSACSCLPACGSISGCASPTSIYGARHAGLFPAACAGRDSGLYHRFFRSGVPCRHAGYLGQRDLLDRLPRADTDCAGRLDFRRCVQISIVNNNSREEQIQFFSNVGNTYSSIVFIIASGGIMCAKLAITVLAVPSYYIGWTFIPVLAVGAGFNCLSSFQKSVYLLGKTHGALVPVYRVFRSCQHHAQRAAHSALRRHGCGNRNAHQLCCPVPVPRGGQPPLHAGALEQKRLGCTVLLLCVQGTLMLLGAAALAAVAAAAVPCCVPAQLPRACWSASKKLLHHA